MLICIEEYVFKLVCELLYAIEGKEKGKESQEEEDEELEEEKKRVEALAEEEEKNCVEGKFENEEEEVNVSDVFEVTILSPHFEVGTEMIPLHIVSCVIIFRIMYHQYITLSKVYIWLCACDNHLTPVFTQHRLIKICANQLCS